MDAQEILTPPKGPCTCTVGFRVLGFGLRVVFGPKATIWEHL